MYPNNLPATPPLTTEEEMRAFEPYVNFMCRSFSVLHRNFKLAGYPHQAFDSSSDAQKWAEENSAKLFHHLERWVHRPQSAPGPAQARPADPASSIYLPHATITPTWKRDSSMPDKPPAFYGGWLFSAAGYFHLSGIGRYAVDITGRTTVHQTHGLLIHSASKDRIVHAFEIDPRAPSKNMPELQIRRLGSVIELVHKAIDLY